jgi:hypothetical protein
VKLTAAVLAFVLLHWPALVAAQTDVGEVEALANLVTAQIEESAILSEAKSLHCVFGAGYQANWRSGAPVLEKSNFSSSDEPMTFYSIDFTKGRAKVMGNSGTDGVVAIATASGVSFLENTPGGGLNVTTVFASREKDSHAFPSVHSRHVLIFYPLPSQFHGTCTIP